MTPLYCHKCGSHLPTNGQFCPTCGTPQNANDHAPTNLPEQGSPIIGTGRLPPGRILHQRYRLLHTVGRGGMGAVYVAQDTQLGDRLVAVKEMSMSRLTPQELPRALEQFRSEAHLLASLQHPNLPAIHEYFSENDRWYLIMSFIEGQSLQTALDSAPGKKFPLKDALHISIELCEVLDYLHSHVPQIIFRDLKPSNIMLTPKGHVCLIDFGIARHFKQEQTKDTAYYYWLCGSCCVFGSLPGGVHRDPKPELVVDLHHQAKGQTQQVPVLPLPVNGCTYCRTNWQDSRITYKGDLASIPF